nr:MAG TPA: hypothetical protein [Caudoviricetes sp.]
MLPILVYLQHYSNHQMRDSIQSLLYSALLQPISKFQQPISIVLSHLLNFLQHYSNLAIFLLHLSWILQYQYLHFRCYQ